MSVEAIVKAFDFESQTVRVEVIDGEPWFVAKDVAEVLGYTWSGTSRVEHVPEQWRVVTSVVTTSGTKEMICLSEQGLYFFLNRSDKPKAIPVQMWIAGEVLPSIRKTGQYAVKPQTQAEMMLASAQMHVEQERRLAAITAEQVALAAKQAEITDRVEAIEARALAGSAELLALPAPVDSVDPLTERALVVRVVRGAVFRLGVTHSEAFGKLYREFRDRTSVDLVARGRNRGQKPLDVAEADGVMAQLYAVAYEIYEAKPMPIMGPDGE
jgi:prophage antirepressor-like protein